MKRKSIHALLTGCLALAVSFAAVAFPIDTYASLKGSSEDQKKVLSGKFIGADKTTGAIAYPEEKTVIVREDIKNTMMLTKDRRHLIYQKTDGGLYESAPDGTEEHLIKDSMENARSLGIYGDTFWFAEDYNYYLGTTIYRYDFKTQTTETILENAASNYSGIFMERTDSELRFYSVSREDGQMTCIGECSSEEIGDYSECPYVYFNEYGGAMTVSGAEGNFLLYYDGQNLTQLTETDRDVMKKYFSICGSENYLLISEYNRETGEANMYLRFQDQELTPLDLGGRFPMYSWLAEGKDGCYTLISEYEGGNVTTYLYWIPKNGSPEEIVRVCHTSTLSPEVFFIEEDVVLYLDEEYSLHRATLDGAEVLQDELLLSEPVKSIEARPYDGGKAAVVRTENSSEYLLRTGASPLLFFGMFCDIACLSEDGTKAYWTPENGKLMECDLLNAEASDPVNYHIDGVYNSGKEIFTYIVEGDSVTSGLLRGVDPEAFIFRKLESDNMNYGYYYYDGNEAELLCTVEHGGALE